MNKSKIEWCDMTWNPVTGCLHGCEYCYARGIAHRSRDKLWDNNKRFYAPDALLDLHYKGGGPYPAEFQPTFHRYRLGEPAKLKKPQNIFVCSMADLFGAWVPDEWIRAVFEACEAAPQHRYLFLTKNPARWQSLSLAQLRGRPENSWFGFSVTNQQQLNDMALGARWLPQSTFVSLEPLHGPIDLTRTHPTGQDAYLDFTTGGQYWLMGGDRNGKRFKWVIVGAETGSRKGKITPERAWIEKIVTDCRAADIPVFMKDSLAGIWGEPLIQEYPDGLNG